MSLRPRSPRIRAVVMCSHVTRRVPRSVRRYLPVLERLVIFGLIDGQTRESWFSSHHCESVVHATLGRDRG